MKSRNDLPAFFKQLGFKKGVEVGVFRGEFLKRFIDTGLEMTGVDPWTDEDMNTVKGKREPAEETYQRVKDSNCKLIRKTSQEAVKDFADNSLDFVYIDANHSFGHVAMDLMIWHDKVKVGGIISGHDYHTDIEGHKPYLKHSREAIDAFAKSYGLDLQTVGEKDKVLSFFMIKK